jgi:HSP20 family protein
MTFRDLVPWKRGRDFTERRGELAHPFMTLHREMNRLFDEAFRGFDLFPFAGDREPSEIWGDGWGGWPRVELSEGDNAFKVTAELPGLDEKDVDVQLSNGVLIIKGEKKVETEDKNRLFSERYFGRFERRIPVEDVEEDKVSATFKNGVLTVILPRTATATEHVKRIAINAGSQAHKIEHQSGGGQGQTMEHHNDGGQAQKNEHQKAA